jgi:hypothetical protein
MVTGTAALAAALITTAHAVISPFIEHNDPAPTPTTEGAPAENPIAGLISPATPPQPAAEAPLLAPLAPSPQGRLKPREIAPPVALHQRKTGFGLEFWTQQNPQNPGAIKASWQQGEGLADGGSDDAHMAVNFEHKTNTIMNIGGGAHVTGVTGITLAELGYDARNDGFCGPGSPRFAVYTMDGICHFFAINVNGVLGPTSPTPDDPAHWTRIRFRDEDAAPQHRGQPAWPGFGKVKIKAIDLVFDEGTDQGSGQTHLDNVDINGVLIGKPND